jgi:aspartate/tyrosine/aromatic aminotransferase
LRVAAEFLAKHRPGTVYVSNPTWANHGPIMKGAGTKEVKDYTYYDPQTKGLNFEGFMKSIKDGKT